ncbi:MAG: SCP2 sterol-binding domain-containing protein, partial [Lachnospiraceae bacterium]|nr:SCP2 sterol-binding domain-containing protein [Lachnospiraceae bacterium]
MTYEQIVAMMQTYYTDADASKIKEHYAVQFNVTGEGEGAFYLEIAEGKVNVQPFDYVDRNAAVTAAAESLTAITEGKVSYTEAAGKAQIKVDGDVNAAAVLESIETAADRKAAEVKAAEEKKAAEAKAAEE